jgi:hypothetical protein
VAARKARGLPLGTPRDRSTYQKRASALGTATNRRSPLPVAGRSGDICPVALRLRSLDRLIKAHVAMGTVRRHGAAPHPRVCRFETRHAQGFTAFPARDVEQAPKRCDWHHRDHYRARKPDNEISGGDAYQYSRHNEKVGRTANALAAPSHEKFADSHRSLLVHRLIKAHAAEGNSIRPPGATERIALPFAWRSFGRRARHLGQRMNMNETMAPMKDTHLPEVRERNSLGADIPIKTPP